MYLRKKQNPRVSHNSGPLWITDVTYVAVVFQSNDHDFRPLQTYKGSVRVKCDNYSMSLIFRTLELLTHCLLYLLAPI